MSVDSHLHYCICDVKMMYMDGDSESIYCDFCEGFIGKYDDLKLEDLPSQWEVV